MRDLETVREKEQTTQGFKPRNYAIPAVFPKITLLVTRRMNWGRETLEEGNYIRNLLQDPSAR